MKLVKKISITASLLLFIVAQLFSGYLITQSYAQKLSLVEEKEIQIVGSATRRVSSAVSQPVNRAAASNQVWENTLIAKFREFMPDNSALYEEDRSLTNTSGYLFENLRLDSEEGGRQYYNGYEIETQRVNIGGKKLLVICDYEFFGERNYIVYHVLDVTQIYEKSIELAQKEVLVSLLLAIGMALILYLLIQRITKPLKDTNELQQQFIGGMAHELRTPLTAMKGYSQTLLEVELSKEQERKALNYINSECDRLSRLSEKMAELTHLYQADYVTDFRQVSVAKLFEQVQQATSQIIAERELTLHIEGAAAQLMHAVDVDLITNLLMNLINNAATASAAGKSIWLGADEHSLWVRDEGCGIPKKELENVRKAFYRVDKSRSRKSGNMGLGLSICERIAGLHHARLTIESVQGEGTTITLHFTN